MTTLQHSAEAICGLDASPAAQILEMIISQAPLRQILDTICTQVAPYSSFDRHEVHILASQPRDSRPGASTCAQAFDARAAAAELLATDPLAASLTGRCFPFGWARLITSGAGEVLGLFVCHAAEPQAASPAEISLFESSCRLAALAIEQHNLLAELAFRADRDLITGLYNRNCFERLLAATLNRYRKHASCALLYVDLDRMRQVNDVLGHAVGNQLLKEVGQRFVRAFDRAVCVARLGGDEFAILLPDVDGRDSALRAAAAALETMRAPFHLEGHEIFASASIGIGFAAAGHAATTPASLEREAYIALYHAKRSGKATAKLFHPSMASTPPERLEMEKRLRFALEKREMLLYYQPQVCLASGEVSGAECLIRWRAGEVGLVSPAAFVPLLEETGMIADFGRWVIEEACRQGREWLDQGGRPLRLGINVSALQFARPEFVSELAAVLSSTRFPPELVELELTESLLVGDFSQAAATFARLRETGVALALDDFGTGQSALTYLQNLRFHRRKIDQAFIREFEVNSPLPPLVANIIQMAQALGMATIAEGIEIAQQAALLRDAGCDEGQGYFWAPPLPAAEFAERYCLID